jgi:hypothetical protein
VARVVARGTVGPGVREIRVHTGLHRVVYVATFAEDDHFEGRSYPGWHRHVALAAIAYAFLQYYLVNLPITASLKSLEPELGLQLLVLLLDRPALMRQPHRVRPPCIHEDDHPDDAARRQDRA